MTTVLVGFDGSPASAAAIDTGARLLPNARATVAYVWTPPFADPHVRQRLAPRAGSLDELVALIEREGGAQAERLATAGATLARAAGWDAEAILRRGFGGEGYELAQLADELAADVLVLGSRGLGGVRAVLGSTSDLAVHASSVPAMVVPYPLLSEEQAAAVSGPVLVGYDASAGARRALATAASMLPNRLLVIATVTASGADAADSGVLEWAGVERSEVIVLKRGRDGERGVVDLLVRCAAERGAGLVVVGSRGRSAARKILLGSVATGVLHHAQRPVLVVPGERFA